MKARNFKKSTQSPWKAVKLQDGFIEEGICSVEEFTGSLDDLMKYENISYIGHDNNHGNNQGSNLQKAKRKLKNNFHPSKNEDYTENKSNIRDISISPISENPRNLVKKKEASKKGFSEKVLIESKSEKDLSISKKKKKIHNICNIQNRFLSEEEMEKIVREESNFLREKLSSWLYFDENVDELKTVSCSTDDTNNELGSPSINVHPCILKSLYYNLKFHKPTQVQKLAIYSAIQLRNDIIASAPTGSGKTLAFAIPIVSNIINAMDVRRQKSSNKQDYDLLEARKFSFHSECVIICPSRELCKQIFQHISEILIYTPILVVAIFGGISIQKQLRLLSYCPQILVATIGRLNALLMSNQQYDDKEMKGLNHIRDLSKLRYFVIDEADKFIQKSDLEEITKFLDFLYSKIDSNDRIQNFLFSASLITSQKNCNKMNILKILFEKVRLRWKKLKKIDLTHFPTNADSNSSTIRNSIKNANSISNLYDSNKNSKFIGLPKNLKISIHFCQDKDKEIYLAALILRNLYQSSATFRILIFVQSVSFVLRLEPILNLLIGNDKHQNSIPKALRFSLNPKNSKSEIQILGIHSKLSQRHRLQKLEKFSNSKKAILVCTDITSRGIDFKNIDYVINLHLPKNPVSFLHRAGRTARLNSSGECVCFCGPQEISKWTYILSRFDINLTDLPKFDVLQNFTSKVFSDICKRYRLCVEIESHEHRLEKFSKEKKWRIKVLKDCEIDLDNNEDEESDGKDDRELIATLKSKKKNLIKVTRENPIIF